MATAGSEATEPEAIASAMDNERGEPTTVPQGHSKSAKPKINQERRSSSRRHESCSKASSWWYSTAVKAGAVAAAIVLIFGTYTLINSNGTPTPNPAGTTTDAGTPPPSPWIPSATAEDESAKAPLLTGPSEPPPTYTSSPSPDTQSGDNDASKSRHPDVVTFGPPPRPSPPDTSSQDTDEPAKVGANPGSDAPSDYHAGLPTLNAGWSPTEEVTLPEQLPRYPTTATPYENYQLPSMDERTEATNHLTDPRTAIRPNPTYRYEARTEGRARLNGTIENARLQPTIRR